MGQPEPEKGYILYAFSPASCPLCEENNPNIEALAAALPKEWVLLSVAVDDSGLKPYIDRLHVTVPVLAPVSPEDHAEYGFSPNPRFYILDTHWKLVKVLDGAYQGEVAKELKTHLGIDLPTPATGAETGRARQGQELPTGACLDNRQRLFSRGAKAEGLGLRFECGAGGIWTALK